MDAGDLHWQRQEAGLYLTQFWANGYKYKIENYYTNTWHVYYRWDKWSESMMYETLPDHSEVVRKRRYRWVKVVRGYGSSQSTLKHAKRVALSHNLRPRRKFRFIGRVTEAEVGKPNSYRLKKYVGFLKYQEVHPNGQLLEHQTHYLNPVEIGGEDRKKINEEKEAKQTQQAIENLAKAFKIQEGHKL